jgi:large subunit ribosomal protein L9
MELILLEKVRNLGVLGDKVSVKPGYGRNYLVPQGKAVPATKPNIEAFEKQRAEYQARADKLLADAQTRVAAFENGEVIIAANASPEGKLFGSVGPREIAEAFTQQGLTLENKEVTLPEGPIRNTGDYDVEVSLHADVKAAVKVRVVTGA